MLSSLITLLKRRMEVDDNEGDVGSRLRPIFCSLGEITRADGSVMLCQGNTTVACSVYGPGEVRQARELIDRSLVEVCYKPRLGLPGVKDRDREETITRTCTAAVLTTLHPRTAVTVNLQEMQDGGCIVSTCINAACLALLDASVPMRFLIAAVTVIITKDGRIVTDPTTKQAKQGVAEILLVFESREKGIITTIAEGRLDEKQFQQCIAAAKTASNSVFEFYRKTISRKFSKEC